MMSFEEHCLRFDCAGESLVGILSQPEHPRAVGLVIVVGGPQYRAGSHRQFALLARRLASAGHAVLRFDCRGMGDSPGQIRSFLGISKDIAAAMGALQRAVPEVAAVALWGLCDGASASLIFLEDGPTCPLAGLCLLNPWVRSAQSLATAQVKHYYTRRLREPTFWRKLARGQVGLGRIMELASNVQAMLAGRPTAPDTQKSLTFQQRMASAWMHSDCPILLIISGRDLTGKEFTDSVATDPAWRGALARPQLQRLGLPMADHTFSDDASRSAVEEATLAWLGSLPAWAVPGVSAPPRQAGVPIATQYGA